MTAWDEPATAGTTPTPESPHVPAQSVGDRVLRIAELFGPTVQGEGPSTGRRAMFVRLGGCNLSCGWCDTPYTWDWSGKNGRVYDPREELRAVTVAEVVRRVERERLVVVTGGEPLLHGKRLRALVTELLRVGHDIEVETNGTVEPFIVPSTRFRWNVSPKLAHSGDPESKRIVPDALALFGRAAARGQAAFKFVLTEPADFDEAEQILACAGAPPDVAWAMPEGRTPDEVSARLAALAPLAIDRGWNVSGRLHVAVWGDRRGV